ncbi:ATP-dependent nuclease [Mesorhizobium sp. CA12]|uniref:ATP-dependent nuclease n=1 Tax=Mesorhizobium sp. CA12 TaxID=2876644 RepID=UPI001CC97A18|nr:ATP-binding protein [Mesorhizobium sp. CA12]MBZ9863270.1 ATP-binding protein [Mesorhizobium sp. CA12]
MEHPLHGIAFSIRNFKSFGRDAFDPISFRPINVIIGRNNSGKSSLVDAMNLCISRGEKYVGADHDVSGKPFSILIEREVTELALRQVFHESTSGGSLPGNHWHYGKRLLSKRGVIWYGPDWKADFAEIPRTDQELTAIPRPFRQNLAQALGFPFENLRLVQVAAERDVRPEPRGSERTISPNGGGVTNLVRAFINSDDLPRNEVEIELLRELNEIYLGDCSFTAITCRENKEGVWEIFLREDSKGDIRLSQSGSSLKSIFIILATLRLVPKINNIDWTKVVLSLEEPENNLHPALLRRLLNFLARRREEKKFSLIVSTHSPIGIDWSTKRSDTQIVHIKHDGVAASAKVAIGYGRGREILDDLDIRASDILQANGVIWVEGPSDRIYMNNWITLNASGQLKEGVHYSIMFYGGKLLSHLHGLAPGEGDKLISLLALNRNAALLIDSDRHRGKPASEGKKARKPRMHLNDTKLRLKQEFETLGGYVWITEGREVENYIPPRVLDKLAGGTLKADCYDDIVALPALKTFGGDKIAIAHSAVEALEVGDIVGHLDLKSRLDQLCEVIAQWNSK